MFDISELKFNENGLIPAITQDCQTMAVLMLGYMNKESLEKTIKTGKVTYFSRSRSELWTKGETSGNFQVLKEIRYDCDADALLVLAQQIGPACHTGEQSCFYRYVCGETDDGAKAAIPPIFQRIYNVVLGRREKPVEGSYTNYLFESGLDKVLMKLGEETTGIMLAAKNHDNDALTHEISDLLYHMMVMMVQHGLEWDDVAKELTKRYK